MTSIYVHVVYPSLHLPNQSATKTKRMQKLIFVATGQFLGVPWNGPEELSASSLGDEM
jgi:hypothetical protein